MRSLCRSTLCSWPRPLTLRREWPPLINWSAEDERLCCQGPSPPSPRCHKACGSEWAPWRSREASVLLQDTPGEHSAGAKETPRS